MSFQKALQENNTELLKNFDKVDLHNHAFFSCQKNYLDRKGYSVLSTDLIKDYDSFIEWCKKFESSLKYEKAYKILLRGNLDNCVETGVKTVAPSISYRHFMKTADINAFITLLQSISMGNQNTNVVWDLGISREKYNREDNALINELIESGLFKGIDLYGKENSDSNEKFIDYFKRANKLGMITKVHAGEQLGAYYIKKCILDFNPKHIQHGIKIVEDKSVIEIAKKNDIIFNVCPTSNIKLGAVKNFKEHPIRKMYDSGLKVTIATDDLLVFDSDINNEYQQLYNNRVFSANELNGIREDGLRSVD